VIVAAAQSDADLEFEPDEIRNWLRKSWNTQTQINGEMTTVGDYVMAYY
jgi:hypothetical protein